LYWQTEFAYGVKHFTGEAVRVSICNTFKKTYLPENAQRIIGTWDLLTSNQLPWGVMMRSHWEMTAVAKDYFSKWYDQNNKRA